MNAIKTEAIVLRHRKYSESSLVATLLGRESGRLDVLAKGCRRDKSPLFGHLDLYQKEHVLVLTRSQASLDLLTEAAFVDEHVGLRFFPPAFAAAGLLADFAATATLPGEALTNFYDVLAGALAILSELGNPAARAGFAESDGFTTTEKKMLVGRTVKLALLDMLSWLGFGLELNRCVRCGADAADKTGLAISRSQGGLVCDKCRHNTKDAVAIRPAAMASLRRRDADPEIEMSLPASERSYWLWYLVDYCQYVLEKPLRGKKVLSQILR